MKNLAYTIINSSHSDVCYVYVRTISRNKYSVFYLISDLIV